MLPGDDTKYMPQGYLTQELGPRDLIGHGQREVQEGVERLINQDLGGCPFGLM